MQNIEFKAELRDLELARAICKKIGAHHVGELHQTDTYMRVTNGRLKRRECPGEPTEIIFYERPNKSGACLSNFTVYTEEQGNERFGSKPLPVWVRVIKRRSFFLLGNVRIHLDVVEDLGTFLEFEALVSSSQTAEKCRAAIAKLRETFALVIGEPISASYSDLMACELETTPIERPDQSGS